MADLQQRAANFKKILTRNMTLPLILSGLLSAVFIGLIFYMLSVSKWIDHTDQVIGKINRVIKITVDGETGLRGYLLTGSDSFLEPYHRSRSTLDREFEELKDLIGDNPAQISNVAKIKAYANSWHDFAVSQIKSKKSGKYIFGERSQEGKEQMDSIRAQFNGLLEAEHQLRDDRAATNNVTVRWTLAAVFIFSIICGAFIAFSGRRQLLDLSTDYEDILLKQRVQNEALQEQAWLQATAVDLVEKIRGEGTTINLGRRLLDFLIPAIGGSLGAVYVRAASGNLERVATYGYSDGDEQSKKFFETREGLLGQAAESNQITKVENIPDTYVKVVSSLGEAKPRTLLLVPLTSDGLANSVLEIAFLNNPASKIEVLLKRVQETLGVAVRSALYRARLQDLLEESQQLNEELQTQQEELRTSNEELAQQTQALQSAQARLEGQHAEMEQTNQQLEEQARQLEHQKDDLDQQNITLKATREAMEQKAQQLESANRYKSEFLANMSHELRTPLNSSLILAKLLKDNPQGNLSEEQVEFASTIYSSGNDLLNLINDILDLSKVEAGKLEVVAENVSVAKLAKNMETVFTPIAKDKKIKFNVNIDSKMPALIETDILRLEQILKNLLSNAFKFTKDGSVNLEFSSLEGKQVAIKVKDTGIGIDASQGDVIFEAFRQADGTTNRNFGGTGLGLTISRNLAHLLGGTISLESELGKGSTFTVVLPESYSKRVEKKRVAPVPAPSVEAAVATVPDSFVEHESPHFKDDRHIIGAEDRKTLLVVEDDAAYAKVIYELSHELKYKCIVAHNATEGFQLANKFIPQAIILDMKLPDGSGLALLKRLKENPKTRHVPVHGISSADYSREAMRLGAVGYALKPTDMTRLKDTFKKLEEKVSQQLRRVLIVEDDLVQRESIKKLIGGKGIEITSVGLASEALQHLGQTTFDCVIIDLKLPDMSGFELLEKMSNDDKFSFPPIIVYTGKSLTREEEETLSKYSKTIIIKGARSPERLLDEVTLFLHQVEADLSPELRKMLSTSRNRERAFEGRKVLLVDDDVRNIFALRSTLQQKGADIVIARNGAESIEKLKEDPEIDLVLMDIMMPIMDGYKAMEEIRRNREFAKLPIIAVTAKAMTDDYEKCLSAGASDYLAKPIDVDKLVSLMTVWLPEVRA